MRRDDEVTHAWSPAGPECRQPERALRRIRRRGMVVGVLALVIATVLSDALVACAQNPSGPALHTTLTTPTVGLLGGVWRDVGLSADEQIVFSRRAPQTAYSCGIAGKAIVMHASQDGGMTWHPLTFAAPIASEFCTLAVDETNPQHLALMTRVTKPDPCRTTACTPTPCAGQCQPCIDYCPPPEQRTLTLYRSADGGRTWTSSDPLPNGVHFTLDIAFAGSTLYAWTDTWPTLLAASVDGGTFRLIDLSAYFPSGQDTSSYLQFQGTTHLWPLRGHMSVPIPGGDVTNQYILTSDGGVSWTRVAFTMDGDPVALRLGSGLDGRTLMGERIHGIGHLALSTDGGATWLAAPAPYPDFSHYGLTQCYVSADGGFIWFNGFDASFGLGIYRASAGANAWTKLLDGAQIQDISVDLVSYDATGRLAALWGRAGRAKWVVYQVPSSST